MPISVLIVDDQRLFRQTLSTFLDRDREIRVVGQAADGHEAFVLAMDIHPDLILMDLRLPKMDGVEATRRILDRCPDAKILMLSVHGDDEHIKRGLEAGAVGYVVKDADSHEFIRIVKHYARGMPITSAFVTPAPSRNSRSPLALAALTRREAEIARLAGEGMSTKEISSRLCISIETVKVHLQHVYRKLDVKNRLELIVAFSRTSKSPQLPRITLPS